MIELLDHILSWAPGMVSPMRRVIPLHGPQFPPASRDVDQNPAFASNRWNGQRLVDQQAKTAHPASGPSALCTWGSSGDEELVGKLESHPTINDRIGRERAP